MHKLVIAEKPSVARSIAAVLNATQRQDGFFIGSGYIVSWCVGHLVELAQADAYGEQYKKWRYGDLPILPDTWKCVVPKDKKKQLAVLRELMKRPDVDTVICATDAGREGELIFRLMYEHLGCKKPIQRLWISSMEDAAIREGFASLRDGAEYNRLYAAALCRAHADWLVGINATRLFSVLYGGATLNVGRVMTPTLALLVKREADVLAFRSEPFYTPEISCDEGPGFTACGGKMKDKAAAESVRAACDGGTATVLTVEKQEKTSQPPRLYDLTTLQREANRLYGYTAQQTLDYLQSLYEKKLATYPRTDSQFLTGDMTATAGTIVNLLLARMPFAQGLSYAPSMKRVTDNSKVSDHHGIIPTAEIANTDLEALPAGERTVLTLIAVRLLCATAPPHVFEGVTAVLDCSGYSFTARGKTILKEGWKAIDRAYRATLKNKSGKENGGDGAQPDDKPLPELAEGQTFSPVVAFVREGKTSPPKRYTEDTLLSAMETAGAEDMPEDAERKGLGTPATRAATIEKLVRTGLVERSKKQLIPSGKGVNLIAVLPEAVKSPLLTAEWEARLKQVERGELEAPAFIEGIAGMVRRLVADHTSPYEAHKSLFASPQGEAVGSCPRCGQSVRERKKGFFCENRDCSFALWKDNRFFAAKKKTVTKAIAAALLTEGRVALSGLHSEKTGKSYDAVVALEDTGKYVNFKL